MPDENHRVLKMKYSGKIIDQLGIQMYQSPIAAIAELIANAWDADAETVDISLPATLSDGAEITIKDDGTGMDFSECEERYLNVGYCRRGDQAVEHSVGKNRPILGRKGIGKFAGFGIAEIVAIDTVSRETGERTVFELELNALRSGEYVTQGHEIAVSEYEGPSEERKSKHGTCVRLKVLKLQRTPSESVFMRGLARRFLLHKRVADFTVLVNDQELPESEKLVDIEFTFPEAYKDEEKPAGLVINDDGWGEEKLEQGTTIRWRIFFYKKPIDEEELRGVSIFSHGKLAQSPFFFNLTGGLGGQHGQEYMSGQVEADYLDDLDDDLISPERQRVDFKRAESEALLQWGQERVKSLFRIWRNRRGESRIRIIEERISPFSDRLEKLPRSERKIVKKAITNLAKISALEDDEFVDLGNSILTSWEGGRLKELISELSDSDNMNDTEFIHALVETGVLTALNIAEAVKTKCDAIVGLKKHIVGRTPENPLRDYIAQNPWLVATKWDTFRKEKSVEGLLKECAATAGLDDNIYKGRIDLALSSCEHLLVIEFMRPGLNLDFDHVNRFDTYIWQIREKVETTTAGRFRRVTGYLIADGLERKTGLKRKIQEMEKSDMIAADWNTLLGEAVNGYREYLEILKSRAPDDARLQALNV